MSLYDEDMKFAFSTFQGGHGPLKFIAFEKSGKNVTLLFGEVFVDVAVVVAEVSRYLQSGAPVFQLKWRRPRKLVLSYDTNFSQCAKKVMSESLGLVDFAVGLVIFVLNLPDGQVLLFGEIQITEGCNQSC